MLSGLIDTHGERQLQPHYLVRHPECAATSHESVRPASTTSCASMRKAQAKSSVSRSSFVAQLRVDVRPGVAAGVHEPVPDGGGPPPTAASLRPRLHG